MRPSKACRHACCFQSFFGCEKNLAAAAILRAGEPVLVRRDVLEFLDPDLREDCPASSPGRMLTDVQVYRGARYLFGPSEKKGPPLGSVRKRVVADLTTRSRQQRDGLTLDDVLLEIHEARKMILEASKDWIAKVKTAETARDVETVPPGAWYTSTLHS